MPLRVHIESSRWRPGDEVAWSLDRPLPAQAVLKGPQSDMLRARSTLVWRETGMVAYQKGDLYPASQEHLLEKATRFLDRRSS